MQESFGNMSRPPDMRMMRGQDAPSPSTDPRLSDPELPEEKLLKVGELARRCGKSIRALHLYEEMELLVPDGRSKGGFRLYAPEAMDRVEWIGKLQDMGFSLTDIQQLLRAWSRIKVAPRAMERIKSLFNRRLGQIKKDIKRLSDLAQEMEESLSYLQQCRNCSAEDMDQCRFCMDRKTPSLVAEFHRPPTGEQPAVPPSRSNPEKNPANGARPSDHGDKAKPSNKLDSP